MGSVLRGEREAEAKRVREERARSCVAEDLKRMEGIALKAEYRLKHSMTLAEAQAALEPVLGSKGEVVVAQEDIKQKVLVHTIRTQCDSAFYLLLNVRVSEYDQVIWFAVWPKEPPQGYDDTATRHFFRDFAMEYFEELRAKRTTSRRSKQAISASEDDPCAPDLSRQERLRRLAKYGKVREVSNGEYVAGDHKVWFYFGELLTRCY